MGRCELQVTLFDSRKTLLVLPLQSGNDLLIFRAILREVSDSENRPAKDE
jgi:hypothetical protein